MGTQIPSGNRFGVDVECHKIDKVFDTCPVGDVTMCKACHFICSRYLGRTDSKRELYRISGILSGGKWNCDQHGQRDAACCYAATCYRVIGRYRFVLISSINDYPLDSIILPMHDFSTVCVHDVGVLRGKCLRMGFTSKMPMSIEGILLSYPYELIYRFREI